MNRTLKVLSIVVLTTLMASGNVSAQNRAAIQDSLLNEITEVVNKLNNRLNSYDKYKLYPTKNLYTFLRLNTKTGQIDQVQWSLDEDEEMYITINDEDFSYGYDELGIFELYPTENMYQFILLMKSTGYMWHVQWGNDQKHRWIRRIYDIEVIAKAKLKMEEMSKRMKNKDDMYE